MDANNPLFRHEDAMQRSFEHRPARYAFRTRFAAAGTPPPLPPARRLPPTRAARPARSRGVFFAARRHSRLGQWTANALCVALATLSIVASAHFAQPAFDAVAISGNAGPGLVASTTQALSFILALPR
jgi:hypothetical protein